MDLTTAAPLRYYYDRYPLQIASSASSSTEDTDIQNSPYITEVRKQLDFTTSSDSSEMPDFPSGFIAYTHTHSHIHSHTLTHPYTTHIHTYTNIHTYTHIHTPTYTHLSSKIERPEFSNLYYSQTPLECTSLFADKPAIRRVTPIYVDRRYLVVSSDPDLLIVKLEM